MDLPVNSTKLNTPNCITGVRLLGTVILLFLPPFTPLFFVIYSLCGASDILDGWVARKTNSTSDFGAKLDSIADLLFYALVIIKLLPVLWKLLPTWFWYIVGGIVLLRLLSYLIAALKFHRFASLHTRLNKLTGTAVFLLPYFLALPCAKTYCFIVVAIAGISTIEEFILHLCRKEYRPNTKALFKF